MNGFDTKISDTKRRRSRDNSKKLILEEAFKLFAVKSYEQVTYNDLEAATGLTRGTVLYHFKSKIFLFKQVIDKYLFSLNSVAQIIPSQKEMTMLEFLNLYFVWIENTKTSFSTVMGIRNMNMSLFNITISAKLYLEDFDNKAVEYHNGELKCWVEILQKAITSGEVNPMINVANYANIFQGLFYGMSYSGSFFQDGIDVEVFKRLLLDTYVAIKN